MTGRLHIRNGKYCIILSYKNADGKARQKWVQTDLPEKNNKRKAEQLLGKAIADFEESITKPKEEGADGASGITMPELMREWLQTVKGTVRGNSYLNYAKTADIHVIPYFEQLGLNVQEMKPVHIQKYYNLKHSEGLSASTIEKHRSVIRGAFVYARDILEIIDNIPSDRAKLPRKETAPPSYYTEQELDRLFKVVDGETVESAVRLCATYGFRRSEVLGLKWEVVDFQHKTITVRRSVIREGSKSVEKETVKKQASYRTMPLIPVMEKYLTALREQQAKDKALCGGSYLDSGYICRRTDGSLLEPNNVTFRFRTIVKQAIADKRLEKYIRFHDLRHSAASTLVNNGCTLKQVQAWLGHANIRSTERYAHLEYSALVEAGNIVNGVFDKAAGKPESAAQDIAV
jgi:integrase